MVVIIGTHTGSLGGRGSYPPTPDSPHLQSLNLRQLVQPGLVALLDFLKHACEHVAEGGDQNIERQ